MKLGYFPEPLGYMKVRKGWFRISGNTLFSSFMLGVKPVREKVGGRGSQISAETVGTGGNVLEGSSVGTLQGTVGVHALRSEQEQAWPYTLPPGPR